MHNVDLGSIVSNSSLYIFILMRRNTMQGIFYLVIVDIILECRLLSTFIYEYDALFVVRVGLVRT